MKQGSYHTVREELQQIQDLFCETCHIYARCYGKSFHPMTDFSGTADEEAYFLRKVPAEHLQSLVASFSETGPESVIEDSAGEDYILLEAAAVRDHDGTLIGVFILEGIASDLLTEQSAVPEGIRTTTSEDFAHATGLIESAAQKYFSEHFRSVTLEARLSEAEESGRRLEQMLSRNEVLTNTLKMLESDNDFTKVAEDILRDTGQYLDVSSAFLMRLSPDGEKADMVCEWTDRPEHSLMRHLSLVDRREVPFLTDRQYTISSESIMPDFFRDFFRSYDITAGVFLPLEISGKTGMYLCYTMISSPHRWNVEELKFIDSVRRVLQTILVKRVTKNSLASSYAALDAILENAGCGICVIEKQKRRLLYANETYHEMFSEPADRQNFENRLFETGDHVQKIREYFAECEKRWFTISFADIRWVDGRDVRMCTIYDITASKDYQDTIEKQANTDYLTGLGNRMCFERDFTSIIRDAVRSGDNGTFLHIDLDDFHTINDGLGHHFGDRLLCEAARALSDIVGECGSCYRIGGDDFAVLVPARFHDQIPKMIGTIQRRFEQVWDLSGSDYYCTMCMGVVFFPKDGIREETLLKRADMAVGVAKQKGKDQIEYYSAADPVLPARRLNMEKAMRDAVDRGCREFVVYYQPVVDITKPDRPCCGAEALVRWKSEELGFVTPGEFIPLAEYLGLIIPIGEHVLLEACRRCRYWNDFGHPDYRINVNLSIVQLVSNDILSTIRNALTYSGIEPNHLTLEVTESLAIQDMEKMNGVLAQIRALGVRIALDDFGTGYSSLSHLRDMPIDVIKIDKCFINDVGEDRFSDAFVKTVADLADTLDVNVVVEGVEEEQQAEALDGMKIDMIQGYLFDQPLPQEEFEEKYVN